MAEALRERWPRAKIGFITGARQPRFAFDDFERHIVDGKATAYRPNVHPTCPCHTLRPAFAVAFPIELVRDSDHVCVAS